MLKGQKIAVLAGGPSSEAAVSKVSAANVMQTLISLGADAHLFLLEEGWSARLKDFAPSFVFNALHGCPGEDGSVQGVLDLMGLPYQGSGVLASALAMDKSQAKKFLKLAGVDVAQEVLFDTGADLPERVQDMPISTPFVLKPNAGGSSVGVHIVMKDEDWAATHAQAKVCAYPLLVEEFIAGRELTVAVLGARPLAVTEIFIPQEKFYNYEAKYSVGGSSHTIPAQIDGDIEKMCMDLALRCHKALDCAGVTRTDLRYNVETGRIVALEVNTLPGMTSTSLVPEQAAYAGMSFEQLVMWMIEDGQKRFSTSSPIGQACCL